MADDPTMVRHFNLIRLLSTRRLGVPIRELARELGVADKTIRRDLDSEADGVPMEERTGEAAGRPGGWASRSRPPLEFTFEEAAALYLGRQLLDPGRHAVLGGGAQSLTEDPQHAGRDGVGLPRAVLPDFSLHPRPATATTRARPSPRVADDRHRGSQGHPHHLPVGTRPSPPRATCIRYGFRAHNGALTSWPPPRSTTRSDVQGQPDRGRRGQRVRLPAPPRLRPDGRPRGCWASTTATATSRSSSSSCPPPPDMPAKRGGTRARSSPPSATAA